MSIWVERTAGAPRVAEGLIVALWPGLVAQQPVMSESLMPCPSRPAIAVPGPLPVELGRLDALAELVDLGY